jgi:hypothetical protein
MTMKCVDFGSLLALAGVLVLVQPAAAATCAAGSAAGARECGAGPATAQANAARSAAAAIIASADAAPLVAAPAQGTGLLPDRKGSGGLPLLLATLLGAIAVAWKRTRPG